MGEIRQWFELTAAHMARCDEIGHARADWVLRHEAQGTGVDDRVNTSPDDVHGRHVMAARTEGAAWMWMGGHAAGVRWHWQMVDAATDRKRPDVGDLWMGQVVIDVKAIPEHRLNLIANKRAIIRPSWMYLLVCSQDAPNFCIYGYATGTTLQAAGDGKGMQKDRPARLIAKHSLADPQALRTLGLASIKTLADTKVAA